MPDLPHRLERSEAGTRIDLHERPHRRRAVDNGALHHARGSGIDIFNREGRLRLRRFAHGLFQRAFADQAAVENTCLVEMDMAVDEAAECKAAAHILTRRIGNQTGFERGDPAILDADIERLIAAGDTHVRNDQIKHYDAFSIDYKKIRMQYLM